MQVELRGIDKRFGRVHANDGVSLTIPAGTIQGILGENGAGKSTLMKVLSGYLKADAGEILLDGRAVSLRSPADAIRAGVGMLHQDPLDFPPMKVMENFLVGAEYAAKDASRPREALTRLAQEMDFSLDADAYIDTLTVGERQQVELLRLLWLGARVLILDEPTTGISAAQQAKLFAALRRLASQGRTVIFVSHKLDDVEQLCDRSAVLRQGRLVGEATAPYQVDDLIRMMFGKAVAGPETCSFRRSEEGLSIEDLAVEGHRVRLQGVQLRAAAGEVLGLAGIEGSGQRLLLQACAGLLKPVSGRILVGGEDLTGKPYRTFLRHGVAYVPASRLEEGLVPGLDLTEHFLLARKPHGVFIDWARGRRIAHEHIEEFNIRGTPGSRVEQLSGGNQQRALLALVREPLSLLLLEHPTRGLDLESTVYLWGKLRDRCRRGTVIMFTSSDLDELIEYSDRILVFFNGRVSKSVEACKTSSDELGELIGGRGV